MKRSELINKIGVMIKALESIDFMSYERVVITNNQLKIHKVYNDLCDIRKRLKEEHK